VRLPREKLHATQESPVKSAWQPIDMELVRDGCVARVTRQLGRAGRWRWAVTPIEVVQRSPTSPVEHAYARGYAKGRDRAIEMAEAAVVALKKSLSGQPT
jgi:hypothetical protein